MGGEALRGREHAQRLAKRGYFVHPVRDDKRPYLDNWQNRATAEADQVSALWSEHPDALVAVVPGRSRLTVVDLDVKDHANGIETLASFGLWDPEHPVVGTSLSGHGRHLWFRGLGGSSQDVVPGGTDAERPTGIDLRGETGYVVVPYDLPKIKKVSAPLPAWARLPLSSERSETAPVSAEEVSAWLDDCPAGKQSPGVRTAVEKFATGQVGHGDVFPAVLNLVGLAADGHEGVREAIEEARALYLSGQWDTDKYRKEFASSLANAIAIKGAPGSADLDWFDAPEAEEFEGLTAEERLAAVTETPEDRDEAEVQSIMRQKRLREEAQRRLDAEAMDGLPTFGAGLLTTAQMLALPAPEPLIDGVMDRNNTVILYGAPGVGKSFLALHWAWCVASGLAWQGRDVRRGLVVYIAAEGVSGMGARLRALRQAWGGDPEDRLVFYPRAVDLSNSAAVDQVVEWVAGHEVDLVVFDTLARSTGADTEENSASSMQNIVRGMDRIREAHEGCTTMAVHHSGHNGKMRGSTAVNGSADSAIAFEEDDSTGALTARHTKRKEGPEGVIVTDLVLVPVEGTGSVVLSRSSKAALVQALPADDDNVLRLVHNLFRQEGTTREGIARAATEALGKKRTAALEAVTRLVDSGHLLAEKVPGQKSQRITITPRGADRVADDDLNPTT